MARLKLWAAITWLVLVAVFYTDARSVGIGADQKEPKVDAKSAESGKTAAKVEDFDPPSRDQREMPTRKKLQVEVGNQKVTLDLVRNDNIPVDAPVILGQNRTREGQQEFSENPGYAFYVDEANAASIAVWNEETQGTRVHKLKGNFQLGSKVYSLEPDTTGSTNSSLVLEETQSAADMQHDSVLRPELRDREQHVHGLSNTIREPRAGKQYYVVESLWFIDYSIFQKWWRRSTIRDPAAREREVVNNIKFYFAHVCNGVDLRYRNIKEPDYEIQIKFTGIYIATRPEDSPWTEQWPILEVEGGVRYVDADKTLNAFEKWVNKEKNNLPPFDQATLFTDNVIWRFRRSSDGSRRPIIGLADTMGVCSQYMGSINKDMGEYGSTQTAAHEMGHNLGAKHDGHGNNCRGKDQYVMASSPLDLTDQNYKNGYHFSYCSKDEFRRFFTALTQRGENCLLNTTHYKPAMNIPDWLHKYPGQMMNPDQQCRAIFGEKSYYCGGSKSDADICRQMPCYKPQLGRCFVNADQRAATGTSCGDKKWCIKNECVYDRNAPTFKDTCMYGDFKAAFPGGLTCADVGRDQPWRCYDKTYRDACCQTCANIRDAGNPACEYGDKSATCHDIKENICYYDKEKCCKTCAQLKKDKKDCEFGDKATWCATMRKGQCYQYENSTCCESCPKLRDHSRPDCPFGDHHTWCSRITPIKCYISGQKCCKACDRFRTGVTDCEFGDKALGCTMSDCKDPRKHRECCYMCRREAGLSTAPPTSGSAASCTEDQASWCSSIRASDCYSIDHVCCRSCSNLKRGEAGCEYGDKVTWCNSVPESRCHEADIRTKCCGKCLKIPDQGPNGPSGCPEGDRASWCPSIGASQCYNADTRKWCCQTCLSKHSGQHDCPYGDRYSWCKDSATYCKKHKSECCASCH